jgi:hypothetical protein
MNENIAFIAVVVFLLMFTAIDFFIVMSKPTPDLTNADFKNYDLNHSLSSGYLSSAYNHTPKRL